MRTCTILAMAFLFVFVGVQQFAQADEVKAKVEDTKGKANAKTEKAKGEAKALAEEAKGNDVSATVERAKGNTKAAGARVGGRGERTQSQDRVNELRVYLRIPCGEAPLYRVFLVGNRSRQSFPTVT